jgi:hypothetical protein
MGMNSSGDDARSTSEWGCYFSGYAHLNGVAIQWRWRQIKYIKRATWLSRGLHRQKRKIVDRRRRT